MQEGNKSPKPEVMIVEDNPQDIHILLGLLKDNYQITVSKSGEQALEKLEQGTHPELILMDVNMPGMSGYEACKSIKANKTTEDIDVVFISGNDTPEEVLQGYEAGGQDYIIKPFTPKILNRKVHKALELKSKRADLSKAATAANQVAMMAMSDTSALGNVVNFLRETFRLEDEAELACLLIESVAAFDFSAVAYFESGSRKYSRSSEGDPSMLEVDLLEKVAGSKTPFIERGDKLLVVQGNIAVLIKNANKHPARMASTKDHLMILLEGANAKLDFFLEKNRRATAHAEEANAVIMKAEQSLLDIQEVQKLHKAKSVELLDAMAEEVEDSFVSMGLSDSQENQLLNILSETSTKALSHFEEGLKMDEKVADIIKSISSIVQK